MNRKQPKVLIAKPGLDGHDVGAKIVVRALMAAGFEVMYTGLRKSVEEIASTARDEDVDVIGFSVLSGSHVPLCRKFHDLRKQFHIQDKLWLVGGNIPKRDQKTLFDLGVDGVFPFGASIRSIVDFIKTSV